MNRLSASELDRAMHAAERKVLAHFVPEGPRYLQRLVGFLTRVKHPKNAHDRMYATAYERARILALDKARKEFGKSPPISFETRFPILSKMLQVLHLRSRSDIRPSA